MVIWARFESEFCDLSDRSRSVDEQSLEEINVNETMLFIHDTLKHFQVAECTRILKVALFFDF